MKTYLRYLLTLSFTLFLFTALTACNTVEGVGKDMQAGGHEIQKAANS